MVVSSGAIIASSGGIPSNSRLVFEFFGRSVMISQASLLSAERIWSRGWKYTFEQISSTGLFLLSVMAFILLAVRSSLLVTLLVASSASFGVRLLKWRSESLYLSSIV